MRVFESHCSQDVGVIVAPLPCLETVFVIFAAAPSQTKEAAFYFSVFVELHILSGACCYRIVKTLVAVRTWVALSVPRLICPYMPMDWRFWAGTNERAEVVECLSVAEECNEQVVAVQQELQQAAMHNDLEQLVEVAQEST